MVEIKNGQVIFSQKYYKTFYNDGILFFKKFYCSNANRTVKESLDFTKNKLNMIMTEAKKSRNLHSGWLPFSVYINV